VFRDAVGISQTQLGAFVGLRQATISTWENGSPVSRPHLRLAADLAKDSRRVFRWLESGGRKPLIVPISSQEPSEVERLYTRAVVEIGQASARTNTVPLPLVVSWLSRLRDAALGDDAMPSDEDVPGEAATGAVNG
jgi:DNA-binding XRE family transcriptional regulator